MAEKIVFIISFSAYTVFLITDTSVPEDYWQIASGSNMLLNIMARVPQIYSNFANKSTGVLAFITFFLAWIGALARTATVLLESDDPLYNFTFVLSATFNTIIIIQFGLYWNSGEKGSKTEPVIDKKEPNKMD